MHDAARALTPSALFDRVIAEVDARGDGVDSRPCRSATPSSASMRATDIVETVDRSRAVRVQTPQGFPARRARRRRMRRATDECTDDAALVSAAGTPCQRGRRATRSPSRSRPRGTCGAPRSSSRGGDDGSAHRRRHRHARASTTDAELWLARPALAGRGGLAGHSDGDAVATRSATRCSRRPGSATSGRAFGTDDPRFGGAHGEVFLRETLAAGRSAGLPVGNVAVQVIGNRPRFAPRRDEAEALLSELVGAPVSRQRDDDRRSRVHRSRRGRRRDRDGTAPPRRVTCDPFRHMQRPRVGRSRPARRLDA